MSTDHTDPIPLEGLIPPEMLLTMNGGEPAIVSLRVEELDAALAAAHDMGLPVALYPAVVEELGFRPDCPGSAEYDIAEEEAGDQ